MRFGFLLLVIMLVGCSSLIEDHGYPTRLVPLWKKIKVGQTKAGVMHDLGTPTMQSENGNIWYYSTLTISSSSVFGVKQYASQTLKIEYSPKNDKVIKLKTFSTPRSEVSSSVVHDSTALSGLNNSFVRKYFGFTLGE